MATRKITRRQALKSLLAAGGGLGAASFLPVRWLKPVVSSGVLPVHAQASGIPYTLVLQHLAGGGETPDADAHTLTFTGLAAFALTDYPFKSDAAGPDPVTGKFAGVNGVHITLNYRVDAGTLINPGGINAHFPRHATTVRYALYSTVWQDGTAVFTPDPLIFTAEDSTLTITMIVTSPSHTLEKSFSI
jgi:hypothetical protein